METSKIWLDYNEQVLRYIKKRVKCEDSAKDILQEVFIKVHTKKDALRDEAQLSSWIYSIAKNAVYDYHRKKQPEELHDDIVQIDKSDSMDLSKCMAPMIHQLPEKYREVIEETALRKVSLKEYSNNLGISYSTIKSRLQRAKDLLKGMIIACCQPVTDVYGNLVSKKIETCKCGCEN